MDQIAHNTNSIVVVMREFPVCGLIFPDDSGLTHRDPDQLLAWSWMEFSNDPEHKVEGIANLAMVKATFQCMKAV